MTLIPDPRPAWQYIVETVKAHPGEITLVTIGPLTNLALALEAAPEVAALVKEVVVMGGAFGVNGHRGNVTPMPRPIFTTIPMRRTGSSPPPGPW